MFQGAAADRRQSDSGWRRVVLRAAVCLPLVAAVLGFGFAAQGATTSAVYGIVTNPGQDCSTQMNVGWHADIAQTSCYLTYTKTSDTAWAHAVNVPGTYQYCDIFDGVYSKTASNQDFYESAIFLDYGVNLTGLEPGTNYMYKVCTGGGACSTIRYFKTAGPGEFSFIWISDFHAYTPIPGRLSDAIRAINAAAAIDPGVDFIFSTGDTIAWGGSYSFWTNMYAQDFIKNYMFANLLGNHDYMTRSSTYSSDYFKVVNHLPLNGYAGQEGVCYWFIYNNVLFITFNNEVMSGNSAAEAAAKAWAGGVIQSLAGQYEYIFLAEHYQWFYAQDGRTSWYANWKGFCDQYGVDLALSGNNHIYMRSYPLYNDVVVPNGQGTVYMEAPSSDGERGVEAGTLTSNTDKIAYTYSSHTISGGTSVKTIGCVLVKVNAQGISTKLVYLDDDLVAHVADEYPASPAPTLSMAGLSRVVDEGSPVSLSVSASGTTPLTYRWKFNGNYVAGATTSQLSFAAAQLTNAGNYLCVVTNASGSVTSRVMSLTVYPAQTIAFLDTFDTNSSALWQLSKSSTDTRVTFNYDYSAIGIPAAPHSTGGTTRGLRLEANMTAGATAALSLSPINRTFAGDYRLRFDLWMNANGPFPAGGSGSSQHATAGIGTVGNRVHWTGSGSTADGYWFAVDGEGQAGDSSDNSGDFCAYAGTSMQGATTGVYTAGTESNAKGSSHPYHVEAFPGGTVAPAWQQSNYPQQSGTLADGAIGFGWREVIVARRGNVVEWAIDGIRLAAFTNAVFAASNVFVGYWDMFTSLTDNTNLSFGVLDNVRVEVPVTVPVITVQPQGRTIIAGESVALTVGAVGPSPLSYQWRCHGTNLPGATSASLVWSGVTTNQTGSYTVVVANSYGAVTSEVATLTVNPPFPAGGWSRLWSLAPGERPYLTTTALPDERGMAYNPLTRHLLLVKRTSTAVHVLDADTGADLWTLNTTGVTGGYSSSYYLLMVGAADDGAVYAGNLTTGGTSTAFKLYRWANDNSNTVPTVAYSGDPGAGNNQRWGDTMDVRGAGTNTQVIVASRNGNVVAVLSTANGTTFTSKLVTVADAPTGAFGLGLAFGAGNTFWGKATSQNLRQVSFDLAAGSGTTMRSHANPDFPGSVAPIGVSPQLNLLAGINVGVSGNNLRLYNLTPASGTPVFITSTNFATDNDNTGSGTGSVDFGGDRVYALGANNGLVALRVLPAQPGWFNSISQLPDNSVQLGMGGSPNVNYVLQWTGDWGGWSNLCTLSGTNGLFWWVDPSAANTPQRFYRLLLTP
ncbi:MAG TPA: immunoglobulin domain-containing protein [Candidatus Paceibacterota bacterium]|nr:immunoglobulin domain-containing protein [Verrucomicrobiota bacterium]HSA10121.1 immunoglobulin domain-containing protein [Candidatus Paceibacterota bacterium]